jgi:divalent metal cation (Fe/Co/Zn/Cd) transporter
MTGVPVTISTHREEALARRVRWLVTATITYNVVEAVVALAAGAIASSIALLGFGLDSVVEVTSAAAVAWQFAARDHGRRQARERTALRLIAVSFFALAVFVIVDAARAMAGGAAAEHSRVVSLVIMPVLSVAQRHVGQQLGSASAVADSKQTLLCTYLSGVLLFGLIANATLSWTWADPIAGLVIAAVAVREGYDAWHGNTCCTRVSIDNTHDRCTPDCDCCS